jgi:hypothetical protein
MRDSILNGWKDISLYLECTVRTAQRWESQLSMPVHRPTNRPRRPVVAFADELDVWILGSQSKTGLRNNAGHANMVHLGETLLRLQTQTKELSAKLSFMESQLPAPSQDGSLNSMTHG